MIAGIFHAGSGLGNMLHRYVFARVKALDLGVDFGMKDPHLFKGSSFMSLDTGKPLIGDLKLFQEERVNNAAGVDIRPYDPRTEQIEPYTLVDGEFQAEKYFNHRLDEVREWLKVEPLRFEPNECVIAFRGGEYTVFPDLFLTRKYWQDAMDNMRAFIPNVFFRVVTDDVKTAKEFFPALPISHEIGHDWRSIRYAPFLILSNSSFSILPTLLNENKKIVIAPKYWARHNVSDGYWALEQNCYKGWFYQTREGKLEVHS